MVHSQYVVFDAVPASHDNDVGTSEGCTPTVTAWQLCTQSAVVLLNVSLHLFSLLRKGADRHFPIIQRVFEPTARCFSEGVYSRFFSQDFLQFCSIYL